jgi:hypothetical protein
MAILNPEHLLQQAERLIQPPPAGPPRQVDLRRAISGAYYDAFPDLQEQRHSADYDPLQRFRTSDAKSVIGTSRGIITRLSAAPVQKRKAFLYLLLFPPRR